MARLSIAFLLKFSTHGYILHILYVDETLFEKHKMVAVTRNMRFENKIPEPFRKFAFDGDIIMEEKQLEDYKNKRLVTRLENTIARNVAIFAEICVWE